MTVINGFSIVNAALAISAPKKSEPVSPINIFAGCVLNKRKPREAPIIEEDIIAVWELSEEEM